MKVAPVYLWTHNPFLDSIEIRAFPSEATATNWYEKSGLLGSAYLCYSISDVRELNGMNTDSRISYIKHHRI
jgi:hypothetical protein